MQTSRLGAVALVTGAILTVAVFAFHPSHAAPTGGFSLSQIVHATAIIAAPLLLFGMWELCRWIDRPLARLGLAAAAIALVLTANAAVVSSFVTPAAARASHAAAPISPGAAAAAEHPPVAPSIHRPMSMNELPPLVQVVVSLNRGLAQAHVALLSLGLVALGLALRGRSAALSWAGMAVGAAPLLWQASGSFSPETTTMPFVVFPQCAWLIAAAVAMTRPQGQPDRQTQPG